MHTRAVFGLGLGFLFVGLFRFSIYVFFCVSLVIFCFLAVVVLNLVSFDRPSKLKDGLERMSST